MVESNCGIRISGEGSKKRVSAGERAVKLESRMHGQETENASEPCALPVLFLQLLRDLVIQPAMPGQKWGYPERVLNILETHMKDISNAFEQLDRLITIPLPLAYLQHCKILFLVFVFVYPLTINTTHGIWANVFSPGVLFVALFGFEVLADEMQNPIGDDNLDLNIMKMIAELEGRLCEIINVTDTKRSELRESLEHTLEDMDMQGKLGVGNSVSRHGCDMFGQNFVWLPYPAHIIALVGEKEMGMGDALLQKAGLKRSAWAEFCNCREVFPTMDEVEDMELALRVEAEQLNLRTHFLCLRRHRADISACCRSQLYEALSLQPHSEYDPLVGISQSYTALVP